MYDRLVKGYIAGYICMTGSWRGILQGIYV